MKKILAAGLLIAALGLVSATPPNVGAGSWGTETADVICTIAKNLRIMLELIAGAIAALVIVINGIKWTGSSDDPGARKQAKAGIIHAVVGLVIVLIAVEVVSLVVGYNAACAYT